MESNTEPTSPMSRRNSVRALLRCSAPGYTMPNIVASILTVSLALSAIGCRGVVEPRRALHGEVRVDSEQVGRGSISFFPQGKTVGPAATTAIVNGKYKFTEVNGPYPGEHRVLVNVSHMDLDTSEDEPVDQPGGAPGAGDAKRAPSKARRGPAVTKPTQSKWETECQIAESGDEPQDFDFVTPAP